jgi:hypothetical protein
MLSSTGQEVCENLNRGKAECENLILPLVMKIKTFDGRLTVATTIKTSSHPNAIPIPERLTTILAVTAVNARPIKMAETYTSAMFRLTGT